MQTFLPYASFSRSAEVLDYRRLGKQRVENLQIMQTIFQKRVVAAVPETRTTRGGTTRLYPRHLPESEWTVVDITRNSWSNHPAVKMWEPHVTALIAYQFAICNEWTRRGYKDTCRRKAEFLYETVYTPRTMEILFAESRFREEGGGIPQWLGDTRLHESHRSNLLRKNRDHYSQFGWSEPDNLEYWWPYTS